MILVATPDGRRTRLCAGGLRSASWLRGFVLAGASCHLICCATAALSAETLPIDKSVVLRLQPGETSTFDLPSVPTASLRIVVEEAGVDVNVTATVNGRTLHTFDGDILRRGTHVLAILAPIGEAARLDIVGNRPGSPAGDVRITLTEIGAESARGSENFGLDLLETSLAQRLFDPDLAKEDATAELAAQLQRGRIASGDIAGAARAIFYRERTLTTQSKRIEAIKALKAGLPLWQQLGDRRGEASALNNIGMHYFRMGDGRLADGPLHDALSAIDQIGDDLLKAVISNNICLTQRMRGDNFAALKCFEQALALSETTGDSMRIATAYNNVGGAFSLRGETERAAAAFEHAISIRERIGDIKGTGDPLSNLGLERQTQGRFDEALILFDKAISVYRDAKDLRGQALATRNRGQLYMLLGEFDRATSLMEEALALQRNLGRRDDVIHTLTRLGESESLRGHDGRSVARAAEAIELAEVDDEPHLLAETLSRAARLYARSGDSARALELATDAKRRANSVGDVDLAALAALEIARAASKKGDYSLALSEATAAYRTFDRREASLHRADALSLSAEAHAHLGQFRQADHDYEQGQREIERARSYVFDPELRSAFLATQSQLFLGHVSLLMERAKTTGSAALAAKALTSSERYRGRVLLDRREATPFSEKRAQADSGEHAELLKRLSALAMARWQLGDDAKAAKQRAELSRDIANTEDSLRLANARRAGRRSVTAASADFAAIQAAIEPRTSLIDYFVTDAATYVWIVASTTFKFHVLPGRAAIDATVGSVIDSPDAFAPAPLEDACRLIWQPIAADVADERVIMVTNGSLSQLPYSALRCRGDEGSYYLVERHEISYLPSASLIAAVRGPHKRNMIDSTRALAIVDPIYSRDDARLPKTNDVSVAEGVRASAGRESPLPRLPGGRAEAEVIKRIFGAQRVTVLEGAAASLGNLRDAEVGNYDIVHFATHGLADAEGLAGSGLVLSLFDESGRAQAGFLSIPEIAEWRLDADLVVIGACDSASGKSVAGEAVMSVAYGMLVAGARQVVAPLWAIDDATGSTFAELLYGSLKPRLGASAVRSAQLAMLKSSGRWRAPRYWAAFVAYGNPASM